MPIWGGKMSCTRQLYHEWLLVHTVQGCVQLDLGRVSRSVPRLVADIFTIFSRDQSDTQAVYVMSSMTPLPVKPSSTRLLAAKIWNRTMTGFFVACTTLWMTLRPTYVQANLTLTLSLKPI